MKKSRTVFILLTVIAAAGLLIACDSSGKKEEKKSAEAITETEDKAVAKSADTLKDSAALVQEGDEAITEKAEKNLQGSPENISVIHDSAKDTGMAVKETGEKQIQEAAIDVESAAKEPAESPSVQKTELIDTGAAGGEYVGAKKCKVCHLKQYKSWLKTAMANSFENLKPGVKAEAKKKAGLSADKNYTRDKGCLKCHTTGYGKPGGFRSLEETPDMINIQCEECHGAGSAYRNVMRKNKKFLLVDARAEGLVIPSEDERGCLKCHSKSSPFNEDIDPVYRFIFKERLEKSHSHYPLKYKHE